MGSSPVPIPVLNRRHVLTRFADVFRDAPTLVWTTDETGVVTFVNQAWLAFTGGQLQRQVGDGWLSTIHPDDRKDVLDQHASALLSHGPFTIAFRLRRADNVFRVIAGTVLPIFDADGTFAGHAGTCADVTDQRGQEAALERTVEHLRLVAVHADEMIYRLRLIEPRRIEYMSPGVTRIIGMTPQEFLRDPDAALGRVHPEDRERLQKLLECPPDPSERVTIRWQHPDGREVWAEHRRLPVYDAQGQLVAVDGVATDITRQKKLEQERDAQIALLDSLIAHMHDGVLAETDDSHLAVVNSAFRRMFGEPEAGPAGTPRRSLVPRIRALLANPSQWAPSGGRVEGFTELALADGRTLEHQYIPVRLDDGRVVHMWQFRDITARRQAEEELLTSRHRLRDLSAHLEGAREEERRELARAIHDELGQLLTGIRLEVASAIEKFRTTTTSAGFDVVDRLQGAVGLVDVSIATVRRITTSLRPPMLDHLGLVATIRWEAAVFERRTGIRCRVSCRPAGFETRAHVTVLYRILVEALTNVARHAHAGTVWIRIRQRGRRLALEVRDNGRGIGDDAIANRSTLGLLGMRERAIACGGEVRITRLSTGGTSVVASLPLDTAPSPARASTPDA
jgi:PAS domain S-box-containing protein